MTWYVEKKSVVSTYYFAEDGVLTIKTRYDTNVGIERCWFVSDQIRMRVSSIQFLDGVAMTRTALNFVAQANPTLLRCQPPREHELMLLLPTPRGLSRV